jgi:hypothetical protein
MKKRLLPFCVLALLAAACTKSDIVKPGSVIGANDASSAITSRNNLSQLTANTWIYMKYYIYSTDTANIGTLVYKRDRLNNYFIFDNNTVKFNEDGTVDEYTNDGTYVPGTWNFTNQAQTSMVVTNSYGTFSSNIIKLNDDKFIWNNPNEKTTGIMEPK